MPKDGSFFRPSAELLAKPGGKEDAMSVSS